MLGWDDSGTHIVPLIQIFSMYFALEANVLQVFFLSLFI